MLGRQLELRWWQLAEDVIVGIKDWRRQHPKASLKEAEEALEKGWTKVRSQVLQDMALTGHDPSGQTNTGATETRSHCPDCDYPLEARWQVKRSLATNYYQTGALKRRYTVCPACGARFFPPGGGMNWLDLGASSELQVFPVWDRN